MTAYDDISYSVENGRARIAVNRPDKLNAYRNETADQLRDAIQTAGKDASVRAILLTGEGRAFGAGYDLATVDPNETPALDDVLQRHFNPLVIAMRQSRLPIVAAVNGPCAGAAVGIALAADIVIAARSAYFYEPFVGIALVPDAGNTLFLSRMLGHVRASGMMLLGNRIPAEKALAWGLLWDVVDDADLVPNRRGNLRPACKARPGRPCRHKAPDRSRFRVRHRRAAGARTRPAGRGRTHPGNEGTDRRLLRKAEGLSG
ncbi:enoyl-CoA hydratase-related protein [Mesorhizobium sp. J428]|uniref:enoyl-CoA hydratase-related protein n=1 Tax=Mesorhizobium sp. J428 TaxID=2898440 RepID=UPI002150E73C|nr:enoyl-CoA hydratase-related protein [Mesorhizobium sp. J428]MCR5855827.1 enoyl-CoA hydratase-related protein [Mesorhizobium sp. J428]